MHGRLADHPQLPWSGATPISAQCSYSGAKDAQQRADVQTWIYLALLRERGGLTDLEAAKAMGIERTSINARRNWLRERGFVKPSGETRPGPTGVKNTIWIVATTER